MINSSALALTARQLRAQHGLTQSLFICNQTSPKSLRSRSWGALTQS